MRTMNCRNVEKFVANRNRDVKARQGECTGKSELRIESILGTNAEGLGGTVIYALSAEEVIYYSCEYFIVHNLLTKENSVINRQGCTSHTPLYLDHFLTENGNDLILTVEKTQAHLFLGQLEITGSITESNGTNSQSDMKNYNWKISRLTAKMGYNIESISYHPQKQYLYMLTSKVQTEKVERCLWIYDVRRECMLMSPEIKASAKAEVTRVWVTEDPSEIYLMGKGYFRFWTISFNEKTLKQSNYRNIERSLAQQRILRLFNCHSPAGKLLAVLTDSRLLLLKRNELLSSQQPPTRSLKKAKSKDNIQVELENSLNQIYRMKFLFDEEDGEQKPTEDYQMTPEQTDNDADLFVCSSQLWQGEAGECIMVATRAGHLLTFSVVSGQMRLLSQLQAKKNHHFDHITASRKGDVVLLSERQCQHLYIINKYSLSSEDAEEELKPFWGCGHVGKETVIAVDSPALHQRVATLGEQSTLRLWSFRGRERKILFEERLPNSPNQVTMHPCGLLLAINYAREIKLMSLLPTGLYEVMSAKTNYSSIGLAFSESGNLLVSNQQNLLIFYNPFTLKTLGYLQPPELKSTIVDFQVSADGNLIAYLTSDGHFYLHALDLNKYSPEYALPAHIQKEIYTCFYFQDNLPRNSRSPPEVDQETLLLSCSTTKYMALYRQLGKQLVIEWPVVDCYLTSLCVADGWLFAATSKGSIRVYRWPILEEDCELEIVNFENRAVKFKHPNYEQFSFWGDGKRIVKLHKLGFSNKLLVGRQGGIMAVIRYEKLTGERSEQGERKKLIQVVNETFFITKNESEKRNRLIEKTEGDILKVENEIAKEKSIMERKYREECAQIEKNYQEKCDIHNQEKQDYLLKLKAEINHLTSQINAKRAQFQTQTTKTLNHYAGKKAYEDDRNANIQADTQSIIANHKKTIAKQIEAHKQQIRALKNDYRTKIIEMRKEFQSMVAADYPGLASKGHIKESIERNVSKGRISLRITDSQDKVLPNILEGEVFQEEINSLSSKVEEVRKSNDELFEQLEQVKRRVKLAENEDQSLQKDFQRCLQEYNSNRFSNLSLHSQVLKMRTQLIERKEIMQNKQQIINVAFQQRQKLENYKELVKGSLSKLQDRKEQTYQLFVSKENELALIFSELTTNLEGLEELKRQEKHGEGLTGVLTKEKEKGEQRVEVAVNRLKELKRFLLLQGLTEDAEQKKLYVEQQNLLANINFYKKRMSMQFLKEKKNKVLKKSALNLVLKQNKNLLEECNQLREETIEYEHQIKNLGRRLGEANRMISIETKLKDQKYEVVEQRNQLEAIRSLFNDQMASYEPQQLIGESHQV